jgi:hypothetical protein
MSAAMSGLCASCVHARQVSSARGSTFWLCRKSESDARFPKYPRLPVLRCEGHEPPRNADTPAHRDGPGNQEDQSHDDGRTTEAPLE